MYKKRDRGGRASYGRNLIKSHLPRLLSAYCFQLCFSWRIPIYFYNSKMSFFSSELSSHINYHVFAPSLWLFLWNCRNDSSVIMPQIANIYLLNGITHEPFFLMITELLHYGMALNLFCSNLKFTAAWQREAINKQEQ